MRLGMKSTN